MVSISRCGQATEANRIISIIFSAWKKTLDLAAELLNGAGLKHNTIHGSLSLKQRLRVLKDFKTPVGPNILLMTLGTGAEGFVHTLEGNLSNADTPRLTLTIASHIYLLEPQWNPFIELQAMARAQRIGQTKQVVCVRYVMKETIEQVRVTRVHLAPIVGLHYDRATY
jgi:SWI/SNF-related matrix-associated actin-dependent regulator of chromatin subfamily A3